MQLPEKKQLFLSLSNVFWPKNLLKLVKLKSSVASARGRRSWKIESVMRQPNRPLHRAIKRQPIAQLSFQDSPS